MAMAHSAGYPTRAMAEAGGLSAHIRREVERGAPRDEIVAGLLQRGLSQASADRFVDRAIAARDAGEPAPGGAAAPRPTTPRPPASADDEDDKAGRGSLISGAFWLSLGCSVTGITYLLAKPGGTFTLAYGAMAAGLVAFIRGFARWNRTGGSFPLKAVAIAGLLPVIGISGLVGFVKWRQASRRADARTAVEAVEAAKAADARAEQDRLQAAQAAAAQRAASEAEVQQRAARVERHVTNVRGGREMACDSALELGRMGAREAIPDLQARLADASDTHLQACAAEALVTLGETEGPRAFYVAAAASADPDLQRVALMGFASLGPAGVADGLPFAAAGLQNPDSNHRYAAVRALGRMGRDAIPHLRTALESPDPLMKRLAQEALAAMGER